MLTLKAVGDICPGDKVIPGLGTCSVTLRKGPRYLFHGVSSLLQGADILIANLEGILTERVNATNVRDFPFCGLPSLAKELRAQGFSAISVANNHVLEHGPAMFEETVGHLREAGLKVLGLRGTGGFHCEPVVLSVRDTRVGFLAYNWVGTARFPQADGHIAQALDGIVNYTWDRDPGVNAALRQEVSSRNARVHADIQRLRPSVDLLVLCPHWGYEFARDPPYGLVLEARSFIGSGADLILGCHPHVLQGYERFHGKLIFFSLGNFIFDTAAPESRRSAVLRVSLGGEGRDSIGFQFTRLDSEHRPFPASPGLERELAAMIQTSCASIQGPEAEKALDDETVYAQYAARYRALKLLKIWKHLAVVPKHPAVIMVILKKSGSFLRLLLNRLRGDRVRW